MKKYLFIFQSTPYSSSKSLEGLEFALAVAAFAQEVSILIIDNGILQLVTDQNPALIEHKDFTKAFKGLELFGIKNLYMQEGCLDKFNLPEEMLLVKPNSVNQEQINSLITEHDIVLTF